MDNKKLLMYLFLIVGFGNMLMLIDTLLTDTGHSFTLFSLPTNKLINSLFYAFIAGFLLYMGIDQMKKIKQKNEN